MIAGSLKMSPRQEFIQSVQCQVRFRLLRLVGLTWVCYGLNCSSLYFMQNMIRFCGRVVQGAAQIAQGPWVQIPYMSYFLLTSLTLLSTEWNFYFSQFKWVFPFSIAVFLLFSLVFMVKLMILAKNCNFRGADPLRFASQNFHRKAPYETNKHYFSYFSLPKVLYYHTCLLVGI